MADSLSVEEARDLPGLRLVLTAGVPGPWGEAAKAILHVKKIPYVRVRQVAGQPNDALREWTGQGNAPIAVYEDEPPRSGFAEILFLAERLAPTPALVPVDPAERAHMFGLAREICGEEGLGWSLRLVILHDVLGRPNAAEAPGYEIAARLGRRYGYSREAARAAPARAAGILDLLGRELGRQRDAGRRYFLGDSLTALDLYWATFAVLLAPLPNDVCPLPPFLRRQYENRDPVVARALDPALLDHRDAVYRDHLELPLDF